LDGGLCDSIRYLRFDSPARLPACPPARLPACSSVPSVVNVAVAGLQENRQPVGGVRGVSLTNPDPEEVMPSFRSRFFALAATLLCTVSLAAQQPATMGSSMSDQKVDPHGMFAGANKHTVKGSYEIVHLNGNAAVKLGADFNLDGAPDPYVVLSPTDKGDARGALNLGKLQRAEGQQVYQIPAGTDLAAYTHVLIYCKKYNVTLGQSDLAGGGTMHSDGMMTHDTMMKH
jgi:hypothetical protein